MSGRTKRRTQGAAVALLWGVSFIAAVAAEQPGVRLVGRWLTPDTLPTASYAGSRIVLSFKHSSSVSADFRTFESKGRPLYIAVSVDGGKDVRVGLTPGPHSGVVLASGLSAGPHVVTVRKEGEPSFGTLQFSNPKLDVAGRWQARDAERPIIEVIGDSDATGICALGPDSPADAVSIWNPVWASEAVSWVGLLEADLAAVGHPADLVDLAISGSKTRSEAESYDYTAPGYSDAKFGGYASGRHASLVLLWGGGNDRHGGGDLASGVAAGAPLTYEKLSTFEKGVYDQLTKIFARNPGVKVVLLGYIDPTLPPWKAAYDEVESMFTAEQRQRMYFLRVYVAKGKQDACEIDPEGHPNISLHASWAAQILVFMLSPAIFGALDFPGGEDWGDL